MLFKKLVLLSSIPISIMNNNKYNGLILKDAYKQFTFDQDKSIPPEETVKRFKKKLASLNLDILKQTIRIDSGRLDIPVYSSICGKDAAAVIGTKKQMGKGATPLQAEASAVMELSERFSFFSFYKNRKNFFIEKHSNLKQKAISFDMIARSVHDDSGDFDSAKKIFENLPLKWAKAFNLTKKKEIYIPFDWFYAINEFNGTSAGNCVEEALCQGICEIVERHVSSIISQNRMEVPAIRSDTPSDPMAVDMIRKYKNAGIKLYISDFSLDMGIPTVGVLAYDESTFPDKSEIVWTAGTASDPQKALSRALSEVAQLAGDFNTGSDYVASGLPKFKTAKDAGFVLNPKYKVSINALPDISDNNIKIEVENCIFALAKKGMEVITVDTMHPLLGIPSFYTIIPGACFRERAEGTSAGMFIAKLVSEHNNPQKAINELLGIDHILHEKYYISFYIGSCYLALNDPETALGYFTQALHRQPTVQDAASIYSYMGLCLKDLGKYKDALAALLKGEKYDKERTDIYNLMGFCHFKLKEHDMAIESFKKVLRLNPGSAIDYANIASNYRDMGKKVEAIQYYEMAMAMDPEIGFAKDNLDKLMQDKP